MPFSEIRENRPIRKRDISKKISCSISKAVEQNDFASDTKPILQYGYKQTVEEFLISTKLKVEPNLLNTRQPSSEGLTNSPMIISVNYALLHLMIFTFDFKSLALYHGNVKLILYVDC